MSIEVFEIDEPPYQELTVEMILRRADLRIPVGDLLGNKFFLSAQARPRPVQKIVTVTGVHFDQFAGLWLDISIGSILGRRVKGVQYVVCGILGASSTDEGWWIGLGDDPRGQFVKLTTFDLHDETVGKKA